ncbi:MAG: hypothetical protein VST68_11590 [Nitrospirota bacterium]|nr:hypothetical protein [Nitrospirota bacterium]
MRNQFVSIALTVLLSLVSLEEAQSSIYEESRLQKYIEDTLDAILKADSKALTNADEYVQAIAQSRCSSSRLALRMECLIQEAKRYCNTIRQATEQKDCHLYADVLVVNRLSEGAFLDRSEKYRIMSKYKDYRRQIGKELLYKYAAIVAEFKISGDIEESWFAEELSPNQNLAVGIRHFCSEFSNRNKISWQSCVGAVVWFIGISHPTAD